MVELMIYPIVTNYLSVITRYRLDQILSYLLHESFPSNFVLLNFVKYFRKICLKNKNTESTKNLTSYSVTYLKIFLLILLIIWENFQKLRGFSFANHWKFLEIVQQFGNFWWRHHWPNPPPPPSSIVIIWKPPPPPRWWRHMWTTP